MESFMAANNKPYFITFLNHELIQNQLTAATMSKR